MRAVRGIELKDKIWYNVICLILFDSVRQVVHHVGYPTVANDKLEERV